MKLSNNTVLIALVLTVLAFPTLGIVKKMYNQKKHPSIFRSLLADVSGKSENYTSGHFMIYLDVNACLSCTEDMAAWIELENKLSQCGYSFSLYAPVADSFDVAYTMELEGLKTPVQLLGANTLDDLGWKNRRTPIKVLLDNNFEPVDIIEAMRNRIDSRQSIEKIISKVCQ